MAGRAMLSIPLHELNVLFPPTCVFLLVRERSVPSILSLRIRDEEGEWGGIQCSERKSDSSLSGSLNRSLEPEPQSHTAGSWHQSSLSLGLKCSPALIIVDAGMCYHHRQED